MHEKMFVFGDFAEPKPRTQGSVQVRTLFAMFGTGPRPVYHESRHWFSSNECANSVCECWEDHCDFLWAKTQNLTENTAAYRKTIDTRKIFHQIWHRIAQGLSMLSIFPGVSHGSGPIQQTLLPSKWPGDFLWWFSVQCIASCIAILLDTLPLKKGDSK